MTFRGHDPAQTLKIVADGLGIPESAYADDAVARRLEAAMLEADGPSLLRAIRFLADPEGKRIVAAFLGVETPENRKALADAVHGIASAMAGQKAAHAAGVRPR